CDRCHVGKRTGRKVRACDEGHVGGRCARNHGREQSDLTDAPQPNRAHFFFTYRQNHPISQREFRQHSRPNYEHTRGARIFGPVRVLLARQSEQTKAFAGQRHGATLALRAAYTEGSIMNNIRQVILGAIFSLIALVSSVPVLGQTATSTPTASPTITASPTA